jgi:rfaE bifunctional protein kinase chain/domain
MRDLRHLLNILGHVLDISVVVAGDVILDEYLIGRATRLSREAPVPVLAFEQRLLIPGGAGNPAVNLAALGIPVTQVGVVGPDEAGAALAAALSARGVDTSGLVTVSGRATAVKTRIMAHMGLRFPQQVARIDRLEDAPMPVDASLALRQALLTALGTAPVVVFSDYQGGTLSSALIEETSATQALRVADAQGSFEKYVGFDAIKCNADEAAAFLGRSLSAHADFAEAARNLVDRLSIRRCMVITRGGDGATVATPDSTAHVPAALTSEVYDTVGAGDTAVAMLALGLAAGADAVSAVQLATIASGLVVRRVGNYAPSLDELRQAIRDAAVGTH